MDHLLLLPGMLCDEGFWRHQIAGLADICVPIVARYGAADRIEAMADAVLADAPAEFSLAGHSMGGRVALEIYKRAPQRVRKLGLFSTGYRAFDAAREGDGLGNVDLPTVGHAEGMTGVGRAWLRLVIPPYRQEDRELVSAVVEMAARQSPAQMSAQLHAGQTRPDYTDVLPTITCPTLICVGRDDRLRPASVHREMAARIPGSRLVVLENCSHMIAMERPDAVTAIMREWLLADSRPR